MGLLTVYQLDLNTAGNSSIYGTAGPVSAKQQLTPQRAATEYVLGKGFFIPQLSTTATSPLLGEAGSVPQYPYVFAVDQIESQEVPVPVISAGASQTITSYLAFNLPTISLDPTDNATMILVPDVWLDPIVPGLVIASVELLPQALTQLSSSNWVTARTLQGGQTYTGWRMQVTVGLVNPLAIPTTATSLHVAAQALVTILPQ